MTPEDVRQEEIFSVIREVVAEDIIRITPNEINVQEFYLGRMDTDNSCTHVDFTSTISNLTPDKHEVTLSLSEQGDGFVHAMVKGFTKIFSEYDFNTINDFRFASFESKAKIGRKFDADTSSNRSDAVIKTTLGIFNSRRDVLYFKHESRSLVEAGMLSVINAFEYLLNSELAIKKLHKAIKRARKDHRADTAETCINRLSHLIEVNDYQKLMKKLNITDSGDK